MTDALPPSTRAEPVVEVLHGHEISDPYRWLEDGQSDETRHWTAEQNAYTRSVFDSTIGRDRIRERLTQLLSVGTLTAPTPRGTRYFFTRRTGSQNQPVLYMREGDTDERMLLDPNEESSGGTVALDWWFPSRDGRLLAYGYSSSGDEWSTLHILDVDTCVALPDRIGRTRYASIAWLPDGSGFYYTRYPEPGTVPKDEENYHRRLFFHRLGNDPTQDLEIHVADLEREQMVFAAISDDGRYLLATVNSGWDRVDVYLCDLSRGNEFVPVAVGYEALFHPEIVEGVLYVHTNLDAPRYRVFVTDAATPQRENWREIIPESPDAVLQTLTLGGGHLLAQYLHKATSSLTSFDSNGSLAYDVPLPGLGTVTAVTAEWTSKQAFFSFESFTQPTTVFQIDIDRGEPSVWEASSTSVQASEYGVEQVWYASKDGSRVSMFLVYRQGLDLTTPRPTLLTGYGGFNVSHTPLFQRGLYLWLESGGLFALPNLRGGGEYGEEWHQAGMLDRKQNVFDDFICAAEYLIQAGHTDSQHLAILGGSNGGLLVGAALTQRPDLFRAVVCSVPLLDMLRYHHFLIARLWVPEYGSADNPQQFEYLHAYSPYHRVEDGRHYPAVLLTTAESDSRVDPSHARKMTARLQSATSSAHPILLRTETEAGHGIGKPLTKIIDEQTDVWTFLFAQLGVSGPS